MYTKIEFHLYSNYDTSKSVQELSNTASAVYTDLYKCSKSPTKTLGISDYFGNEPQVFNFELEYDDWLKFNVIDESKDLSREFSSYVIRVFENDIYTYSGVLMLEYFKIDLARNRLSLKSYNWLIFLNKIKNTFIWFESDGLITKAYLQYPLISISDTSSIPIKQATKLIDSDKPENASNMAIGLIKAAQTLIFENSWDSDSPIIKPLSLTENILLDQEKFKLSTFDIDISVNADNPWLSNIQIIEEKTEGWVVLGSSAFYLAYVFGYSNEFDPEDPTLGGQGWMMIYQVKKFEGINEFYNFKETVKDSDKGDSQTYDQFVATKTNNINQFIRSTTGWEFDLLKIEEASSGKKIPRLNQRFGFDTVTDISGNIYSYIERRPIYEVSAIRTSLYCNYKTNGASVLWKSSMEQNPSRVPTSDCLKTLCIAANACFVITQDGLDEIKFITKYKDSQKPAIAIADDDLIDDCELSRIAKTNFDSGVLESTISGGQRLNYQDKLTVYYNQFFEQNNTKIKSTVSRIFNNYNIEITDKIDILDYAQVVNSVQTDDEHFIELESMNYMINNWIDELGNHIIDELGNRISFRSF